MWSPDLRKTVLLEATDFHMCQVILIWQTQIGTKSTVLSKDYFRHGCVVSIIELMSGLMCTFYFECIFIILTYFYQLVPKLLTSHDFILSLFQTFRQKYKNTGPLKGQINCRQPRSGRSGYYVDNQVDRQENITFALQVNGSIM